MLVSGGQILAIDRVYTDEYTISGDGVQKPLGVKTDIIATTELVSGTSAELQSEIDDINNKFSDYYNKTETSSKEEISAAFENFKTDQTIVSAGSDIVDVTSAKLDEKTVVYTIKVTPGEIDIAGTSGISAKQTGNTWTIGLSADFLSANALDILSAYYKKSETSAASAIDAALAATSSWANETFASASQLNDYYKKTETSSKNEIQTALNQKQDVSGMSAYQLSGDYVSASDFNTYKELVKQEFTNTSAWATSSFQPSGKYVTSASDDLSGKNLVLKDNAWTELVETDWTPTISAASANAINSAVDIVKNKFELTEDNKASGYDGIPFYHQSLEDYYKKSETSAANEISAAFSATSAWALDTFYKTSEYFYAVSGTDSSSEYFKWTGDTLSASWKVKHFNLSFNYAVKPVSACPDFIYSSRMQVGNTTIDDKHYVEGYSDTVNYNVSFNIYNADDKTYKFTFSADDKLNLENLHISCIGFINPRSLSGYFSYVENGTTGNFVDSDGNKFIFVEKLPVG